MITVIIRFEHVFFSVKIDSDTSDTDFLAQVTRRQETREWEERREGDTEESGPEEMWVLTFLSPSLGRALRDCVRLFAWPVEGAGSWDTAGKNLWRWGKEGNILNSTEFKCIEGLALGTLYLLGRGGEGKEINLSVTVSPQKTLTGCQTQTHQSWHSHSVTATYRAHIISSAQVHPGNWTHDPTQPD